METQKQDAMLHASVTTNGGFDCQTDFRNGYYDHRCLRCAKIQTIVKLRRMTVERGETVESSASAKVFADKLIARFVVTEAELHDAPYAKEEADKVRRAQAEAAAKARAEAEAMRKAAEAEKLARAWVHNLVKGLADGAKAQASAELADRKAAVETAEATLKAAREAYVNAAKVANVKVKAARKPKASTENTATGCNGDRDTCTCRRHAAQRAWDTMRNKGYVNGKKPENASYAN